jgi:hypothetical protein
MLATPKHLIHLFCAVKYSAFPLCLPTLCACAVDNQSYFILPIYICTEHPLHLEQQIVPLETKLPSVIVIVLTRKLQYALSYQYKRKRLLFNSNGKPIDQHELLWLIYLRPKLFIFSFLCA